MDPASAVGVAAAAAQFLGIALKAIRLCYQIRDNADSATDRNRELEELARELTGSNANLTCPTAGRVPRRITNVANKCDRLTKDVLDLLHDTHANSATNITQFKSLDAKVECVMSSLGKAKVLDTERATKMLENIASAQTVIEAKLDKTTIDVTQKISQADTHGLERHRVTERSARERHESTIRKQREDEFLSSLFFSEMNHRQINIRDAAPNTLEWIFYDQDTDDTSYTESSRGNTPDRDAKWDNFYKWLCTESTPYWICGKLGSGKSTLMAHIVEDPRTRKGLDIWKGNGRLCVFKFFFWRPGSVLQKSILGLLRSLLYQICQAEPQLIHEILSTLSINEEVVPVWTTRALATGIAKAFQVGDYLRVCIFIDGLDEFIGDYNELLDLILKIQVHTHVKVCVSSRPKNQIIRRLSHCRRLHLEDLNYDDIHTFVVHKFEKANLHLPKIDNGSASSYLTTRAEGVFQYAVLVTQTVVQGAYDDDDEVTMLSRINSVPLGIREVFESLIDNVSDLQKQSLGFYLSIMKLSDSLIHNSKDRPWLPRWLATVPIITLARIGPQAYRTRLEEIPELCSRTENQIRSHSAGLLDIVRVYPWLDEKMNRDTWPDPGSARWLSPGEFIGDKNWTRRKVVGKVPPYPGLFDYERRALDWVHRSAYDLVHDPVFLRDFSVFVQPVEATLQKLLAGYILDFALAPSFSSFYYRVGSTTHWRLEDTVEALAKSWSLSPSAVTSATDCLYRVCLQCNVDEFGHIEVPKAVVRDYAFWDNILRYDMLEYALERIHEIPLPCLPHFIKSVAYMSNRESRLCAKLFDSLIASLRTTGSAVQRLQRTTQKRLRVLVKREHENSTTVSYGKLMKNHTSNATQTDIWVATGFVELLKYIIKDTSDLSPLSTIINPICAISDSVDLFVGIASGGRRLYLQIAGSLFVDPQGLVYDGLRRLASLNLQANPPLVRLICIPSRSYPYRKKRLGADIDLLDLKEIKFFIKIDLNLRTAILLLNLLRNDLGNPVSLLDLPKRSEPVSWPLIFATEKELRNCHQLIVEDVRYTEQLHDSTEKLLSLACIRVHLWDLLYSIWVRLLDNGDADVNNSLRYSVSEMDQADEVYAEEDGSEWYTDEGEMSAEEQVNEDNDSDWWTDEEEISETRRWLRIRDRMTIIQRNGDGLPRKYMEDNYSEDEPSGEGTNLTCERVARKRRLASRRREQLQELLQYGWK
ncbi:hypothetical protein PG985_008518 [Apiospora marii]|uniref:uncharacterized protein n=1 Tax=Apiospora marii TaxID=335849 RepID=UPI00312DDF25